MKSNWLVLALFLGGVEATVASLLPPRPPRAAIAVGAPTSPPSGKYEAATEHHDALPRELTSPSRGGAADDGGVEPPKPAVSKIVASIAVGTVTAALGFAYGKALELGLSVVWEGLPALLLERFGSFDPAYFITAACTFGGLLLGVLSSRFGGTFTVADFVHAFSGAKVETLPSSSIHLLPILLMSLLTSVFGFSVGPEAPMVCAGALVGSSMSRRIYGSSGRHQEMLSYAGAAGALTAFMGIPVAGSIFAIEMTRSGAGLSEGGAGRSLSPAIVSSIAAIVVIRGVFAPSSHVGGHFSYTGGGEGAALSGRAMIATAVACGAGGALLGTIFHRAVHKLKKVAWAKSAPADGEEEKPWARQVAIKTAIGLLVGIIGTNYPQTLFWGEGSLQSVIDGQETAFRATKHGLTDALTGAARVDPNVPFSSDGLAALQVGVAKMLAIILACVGKFPGGIIFPLFFAAAPFAHAFSSLLGREDLAPVAVFCLMAATQASVTRTPLATALILSLSASSDTDLSAMLPASLVSSYLGVFFARELSTKSYFSYNE